MSLLLQALKKAEESKRQHEQALEILPDRADETLDFPAQEEPAIPESGSNICPPEPDCLADASVESTQPVSGLGFAPAATETPSFNDAAHTPSIDGISPLLKPKEETAPFRSSAPSSPSPADISREEGTRRLLSAPRARTQHRMAAWLMLGGCVLLGGIGMWLWWQIESFAVPESLPAAPATSAAHALAASVPVASSPIDSPIAPAAAEPGRNTTHAPEIRLAAASHPPKDNRAAYIEPQPAPAGLPKIERQVHESTIPAPLESAWNAYQRGDLAYAETQYRHMLTLDSRNRDALLGLAAIAASKGLKQEAASWYKRLLALNSQDQDAQSGLLAIDPDALSERGEAQLLQQTGRADASLLLAQHYAARNRWHEAQEQYFRAFTQDPDNADLAFNLAVSLEHIGQPRQAAAYYRKALALGKGSFDRAAAESRLAEILPEVQ